MYGDGNYISFDNVRYTFNGGCEYTLLQVCVSVGGQCLCGVSSQIVLNSACAFDHLVLTLVYVFTRTPAVAISPQTASELTPKMCPVVPQGPPALKTSSSIWGYAQPFCLAYKLDKSHLPWDLIADLHVSIFVCVFMGLFLCLCQANELLLTDNGYQVIRENGGSFPQQISKMGIYLVIEVQPGLILMWDTKTSLFIKMSPAFQVHTCDRILQLFFCQFTKSCLKKFVTGTL